MWPKDPKFQTAVSFTLTEEFQEKMKNLNTGTFITIFKIKKYRIIVHSDLKGKSGISCIRDEEAPPSIDRPCVS